MHGMAQRSISSPALRAIGNRVRKARQQRRLSQDDLAFELRLRLPRTNKISGPMVSMIEKGAVAAGLETIAGIAVVLDLRLDELAPEYVDDARRLREVIDMACAPWELNPQPADYRSVAGQIERLFDDTPWCSGGSSAPGHRQSSPFVTVTVHRDIPQSPERAIA